MYWTNALFSTSTHVPRTMKSKKKYKNKKVLNKKEYFAMLKENNFYKKFYVKNLKFIRVLKIDDYEEFEACLMLWCVQLFNNMKAIREVGSLNLTWYHCYIELLKIQEKQKYQPDIIYTEESMDIIQDNNELGLDFEIIIMLIRQVPKSLLYGVDLEDYFYQMLKGHTMSEYLRNYYKLNKDKIRLKTTRSFIVTIHKVWQEEVINKYIKKSQKNL